ncbi:hypothetical protein SAMN05444159_1318 [Bradyrhizobium lablabi]|uniref:Uncharacterized protein n=1 Tax=Bradyrhizobium lablabi TaxID=722472 RepID=A0A1M6LLV1_9BRAD|nr:hypothetical protein SAMN05444159_1318 [Bradyrhizobium lablabi]
MDLQPFIACIAVFGFVCAVVGYIVGRAEGKSLAAFPDPTESGSNPL